MTRNQYTKICLVMFILSDNTPRLRKLAKTRGRSGRTTVLFCHGGQSRVEKVLYATTTVVCVRSRLGRNAIDSPQRDAPNGDTAAYVNLEHSRAPKIAVIAKSCAAFGSVQCTKNLIDARPTKKKHNEQKKNLEDGPEQSKTKGGSTSSVEPPERR